MRAVPEPCRCLGSASYWSLKIDRLNRLQPHPPNRHRVKPPPSPANRRSQLVDRHGMASHQILVYGQTCQPSSALLGKRMLSATTTPHTGPPSPISIANASRIPAFFFSKALTRRLTGSWPESLTPRRCSRSGGSAIEACCRQPSAEDLCRLWRTSLDGTGESAMPRGARRAAKSGRIDRRYQSPLLLHPHSPAVPCPRLPTTVDFSTAARS
ncbi:hypothetical protein EJ06DRAFT_259013 [Trichodelitschia bisporula]|uniref:Uncharacterized protein n=1 Tax=Trichodelitschia bisporula TaxID=703511 RepID=A0A6G1HJA5_9PEZI|nr:hypothetical protein EJ06DRAFT_259013 [Trichodelitschia bisporula]